MTREIKFRAWDTENSTMLSTRESWTKIWKDDECDPDNDYDFKKLELLISQDGHVLENTFDHGLYDTHYQFPGKSKYILMQYTGLKDKNGNDVFEGDYLRAMGQQYAVFGEVCFVAGQFIVDFNVGGGNVIYSLKDRIEYGTDHLMDVVCSNRYENPELLEAEARRKG